MNDFATSTDSATRVQFRGEGYTAEAGWFGPEDRPRFGWLYRPAKQAPNNVGIVIVPPFGFEATCAHRTLRHLAEDCARAGFPALRFDLDGSGDSIGDDADPDRVASWLASIDDACDLVRNAGAKQLVLIGARLGAMLAALAAPSRRDVAALVGIASVVRGRDFLREARVLQATMGLRPPPDPQPDTGGQEVNGFIITEQTGAQLKALDLEQSMRAPAASVLLIERDDMPDRPGWPTRLHELGVGVDVQRQPGLLDMLVAPHLTVIPQAMLGACIDFVRRIDACASPDPPLRRLPLRAESVMQISDATIVEQTVLIDDVLFGVLTHPASGTPGPGIVLLNAGAVNHIGLNRMYVAWARQWATQGYWVLRGDLSGIGDSATRVGALENHVYNMHGSDDTTRLAAWLARCCKGDIIACGACSGAYHALRAAIAGDAIGMLILINPGALQSIGSITNAETELSNDSYYNNQIKRGEGFRKLLSGKVSPRKLARVAIWFATTYGKRSVRWILRRLHWPLRNDLGLELESLAQRGIGIQFVFSADDLSRARLSTQAGSVAKHLVRQGRMHVRIIDGPDHTFTQRWAQGILNDTMRVILTKGYVE